MGNSAAGNWFLETTSLPGLIGPTGGEGQIGLLARKSCAEASAPAETPCKRRKKNHGSFSPTHRESAMFGFATARHGRQVPRRRRREQFRVRWRRRFYAAPRNARGLANSSSKMRLSPQRIVYLWNLDALKMSGMATNLDALLHLTQTLESDCSRQRSCVSIW